MVSLLDDLFIFKTTSFQPSGTSSFACVSQSVVLQQSWGSEPCSGLQYRALNWHWVRESTAKEWGPNPLSSVVDDRQPQPHSIFSLCFGSRDRGLVFPTLPSSGQQCGSGLSHVSWETRFLHGFLQDSLDWGPVDELLYRITCRIMITMEHSVFEIKFLDFDLIYDRRYEKHLNQDSLLIRSRLMKKLFYLPPSLPLKDPVINYWQVVRKRDFFSAEHQLYSVFMLVAELVLLFQILTGYVLISSKSDFHRSRTYPWLISPTYKDCQWNFSSESF